MVLLMVLVTALNVLVAAALPAWTAMQQREQEEELIFRGLQYAEAIRVFQARFGRLPVRLEELIEVEPRSIRQLWPDPITGEKSWGLLFGDPSNPGNCAPSPADQVDTGLDSGFDNGREIVTQGPICGVYSRAEGDSIKTFLGSSTYRDWHFTLGLLIQQAAAAPGQDATAPGQDAARPTGPGVLGQPGQQGPQPGQRPQPPRPGQQQPGQQQLTAALLQAGVAPNLSMRWIGRPWPEEIQALLGAAPAGGTELGGQGNLPGQGLDAPQNQGRDDRSIFDRDDRDDGDDGGDDGQR